MLVALAVLIVGAVVGGIACMIKFTVKHKVQPAERLENSLKKWYWYAITVLCTVIAFASWIFNLGWFRVILTWIPIPLIHVAIFLWFNIMAAAKVSSSVNLKKQILLSWSTYLLTYLLFPDFDDAGHIYFFFGLIRNHDVANVMMYVAPIIFIANITILVFEYLELRKCKS